MNAIKRFSGPFLAVACVTVLVGCATTSGPGGSSATGPIEADAIATVAKSVRDAGMASLAASVEGATKWQGNGSFELAPAIADKVASGAELNYVFSYQSTSLPVLGYQMQAGHDKGVAWANEWLNLSSRALAPTAAVDVAAQIAQITALLDTRQVDCLAIESPAPNAMNEVRDRAMSEGIPVFFTTTESDGAELMNFLPDGIGAGQEAGKAVVAWAEGAGIKLQKVAFSSYEPSAEWSISRLSGFQEVISEAFPDVEYTSSPDGALLVPLEPAQSYDAYKAFLTGQPDVDFILNADISIEHANRAIADLGLAGNVHTGGWNPSAAQLEGIDEGTQVVSIDQSWDEQAAYGPLACALFLKNNHVMPNTLLPLVATVENLDDARQRLAEATS